MALQPKLATLDIPLLLVHLAVQLYPPRSVLQKAEISR